MAKGARRIPGGFLSAEAAEALDALKASGYAESQAAIISRALIEAAEKGNKALTKPND